VIALANPTLDTTKTAASKIAIRDLPISPPKRFARASAARASEQ
jgi:hypothetical protein